MLIVYGPITIAFRIHQQNSKSQTYHYGCLWFSYLMLYWLISRNTITFHKYFWCWITVLGVSQYKLNYKTVAIKKFLPGAFFSAGVCSNRSFCCIDCMSNLFFDNSSHNLPTSLEQLQINDFSWTASICWWSFTLLLTCTISNICNNHTHTKKKNKDDEQILASSSDLWEVVPRTIQCLYL